MVLRVGRSVVVYDRPHCSIDREFTVISPELYCVRQVGAAYAGPGKRGYPVLYDDHSAPPPICTMRWRFTGANTNDPVAVRS